jgi:crossover junction endodeoxyribonuclease RuvC
MGIDPGTVVTGYAILRREAGASVAVDYGCIRPPSAELLSRRYALIFEAVDHLCHRFRPDAVAVETQFVAKNPQSALKLGMARGMVLLAATRLKIPVFEYTPSRAKQAVTGNGRASKPQVQAMVARLLSLAQLPEPDDVADALAIALCHAHACDHAHLVGEVL